MDRIKSTIEVFFGSLMTLFAALGLFVFLLYMNGNVRFYGGSRLICIW